jgi:hypothetical protein
MQAIQTELLPDLAASTEVPEDDEAMLRMQEMPGVDEAL